jgi:hypothetical protein
MSKFTVHTIESAPEASKPAMQKLKDGVGLIPNLAAVMANAPALIEAFVAVRAAYQSSSLSAIEREVVSITMRWRTTACIAWRRIQPSPKWLARRRTCWRRYALSSRPLIHV